jgi:hypothetical protein
MNRLRLGTSLWRLDMARYTRIEASFYFLVRSPVSEMAPDASEPSNSNQICLIIGNPGEFDAASFVPTSSDHHTHIADRRNRITDDTVATS